MKMVGRSPLPHLTIEFTPAELQALLLVCDRIGGYGDTRRRFFTELSDIIEAAGYPAEVEDDDITGDISFFS